MKFSMLYMVLEVLLCIVLASYGVSSTDESHLDQNYISGISIFSKENITVIANTTLMLQCPNRNGKVRWMLLNDANNKKGKLLKSNSDVYEIHLVTTHDQGIYACLINEFLIKIYNVTVLKPPYFTKKMEGLVVKPLGNMVRLNCKAAGIPVPNVTWYKDDKTPPSRDLGLIRTQRWSLILEDLLVNDRGDYTCVVCNIVGCINHTFIVDIIERYPSRPYIKDGYPLNLTVVENRTAIFECPQEIPDLQPYIQWARLDTSNYSELDDYLADSNILKRGTDSQPETFQIVNVTHADEGWYACIASNSLGTIMSKAYLQVVDKEPVSVPEGCYNELILSNKLQNSTISVGSNVNMTCKFLSDLHPRLVLWTFINESQNGTLLQRSDSGIPEPELYQIVNATHGDEGWYACVVFNSVGITGSRAYLKVVDEEAEAYRMLKH